MHPGKVAAASRTALPRASVGLCTPPPFTLPGLQDKEAANAPSRQADKGCTAAEGEEPSLGAGTLAETITPEVVGIYSG